MKKLIIIACVLLGLTSWSSAQNGLDFDGIDDNVQTTYAGVLASANRTFEAWVFVSSSAPTSNLAILDYGLNAAGSRNTFSVSGSRQLIFISGGTNSNISTPSDVIPVNQKVHVAFVLDDGIGYLYVNGIQMGTGSLSAVDTPAGNENVKIGERISGGSIPFHGSLDEIRIWDVARTAGEIQDNMNSELCTQQSNLQLHLKLNEGIAGGDNTGITTAADDSANDNDGTLNNFSLTGATSNWVNTIGISSGSSTSSLQESACDTFALMPNSTVYTTSGVYTEVLIGANAEGCDSIIMLDLTIINSTSSTDTQMACDSYTWLDGNTYTSNNNTATYLLSNTLACDSLITLDLTIDSLDSSVSQEGELLSANEIGATYQWLQCPEMTPISGATNQSYTATANGDYAVIVTNDNLCSETSTCYTVTTIVTSIGASENEFGNNLQLFPNPTNGAFSIDMGKNYKRVEITILDLNGKLILSNTFDNSQFLNLELKEPAGVYLLNIEAGNKKAVIRLVKN